MLQFIRDALDSRCTACYLWLFAKNKHKIEYPAFFHLSKSTHTKNKNDKTTFK
jgi:hypothetical protein